MTENPVAITDTRQTGVFDTYLSDSRRQFACRENQNISDKFARLRERHVTGHA
jgi:hypothetical protein